MLKFMRNFQIYFQNNCTIVQLLAMYCSIVPILATVSPNFQPKMSLFFNLISKS